MVLPRPMAAELDWGQLSVLGVGWLCFCTHVIARVRPYVRPIFPPLSGPRLV